MVAASALFHVPSALPAMQLFPDYASMLCTVVGGSLNAIGMEKEALVDAILFLGSYIMSTEKVCPPDGDVFHNTLQRISLLSANSPSAALRYNAHTLTSRLLRSHPSDLVRHAFIRDTLEHCPYENLKASSVGWLKEEILRCDEAESSDPCIFSLPETLSSLAPFLFLDPRTLPGTDPSQDYTSLQAHHSFYLAVLNLYWLLLSSQPLFVALDIQGLTEKRRLRGQFLGPLMTVVDGSHAQLIDGNGTIQDEDEVARNEAELMRGILDQVDTAMTERGL